MSNRNGKKADIPLIARVYILNGKSLEWAHICDKNQCIEFNYKEFCFMYNIINYVDRRDNCFPDDEFEFREVSLPPNTIDLLKRSDEAGARYYELFYNATPRLWRRDIKFEENPNLYYFQENWKVYSRDLTMIHNLLKEDK
jgi:hypothetical protein